MPKDQKTITSIINLLALFALFKLFLTSPPPIPENHRLIKHLIINDNDPSSELSSTYDFYLRTLTPESDEIPETKYYFDIENYTKSIPLISEDIIEVDDQGLGNQMIFEAGEHLLTTFRLTNAISKVRILFLHSKCLTPFVFIDSEKDTDLTIFSESARIVLDFSGNLINNFEDSTKWFFNILAGSEYEVENNLGFEGTHVFLKVLCPYYSNFGTEELQIGVSLVHKQNDFDCMYIFI